MSEPDLGVFGNALLAEFEHELARLAAAARIVVDDYARRMTRRQRLRMALRARAQWRREKGRL